MADQNHFKYEGFAHLHNNEPKSQEPQVVDVIFLTPARLMLAGDVNKEVNVNVDIINRKVYYIADGCYSEELTRQTFEYLDRVNELPSIEPDQSVYDAAADAQSAHDDLNNMEAFDG
jgi:hypothetical protein